jgi:hypothetical protein
MSLYEVAFSGKLVAGAQLESVKANLAKIFQADEQRIALLFSGRRIVIKSGLDSAGAEKYREILSRAGAVLEVRALDEVAVEPVAPVDDSPAAGTSPVATAPEATGKPGKLKVAPRDEYMAAFIDVEAPDLGIAPLGADLQDQPQPAEAPAVDLSQFSLAPVGSDMGQEKGRPAAPPPDTSHLKLQD